MTVVELVVGALAVYRGTVLVLHDRIFEPLRDWVDYRADVAQRGGCQRRLRPRAWASVQWAVTGGVDEPHGCPWCVSMWLAVAATVAALVLEADWFVALCAPLVFSAVAGVLHRYTHDNPADE